jgi:antitoxin (DNA-binding transcriptional repressor) of toxin-antitoxin stability system
VDEDAAGADEATTAVHGAAIARIVPTAKRIAASGDGLVIPCDASVPEMIAALNRWTMRYPEAVHG